MLVTLVHPYLNKQEGPGNITLSVAVPESLTRKHILSALIKRSLLSEDMMESSIVTANPRNYYFDLLLSEDIELYYDEEQIEQQLSFKGKRLIKLPFDLQITRYSPQWLIDSLCETISAKHFDVIQKIGEGTYSQIYLAERRYDRHLFCLKRINKAECKEKGNLQMIKNEFEILEYSAKYKIKLYYQFEDAVNVYFVLDYCPFGDLYAAIKQSKKPEETARLNLADKYAIWIQIALGIANLHQKGLIYRDLKPQNILIDHHQRIRICDFGFACKILPHQKLDSLCGSYEYIAPEMIKKQGYDQSIDLYCLGLLFYELLVGSNPFQGITPKNIMEVKSKPINFEKKQISSTVKDLLKKLLKEKPEERIGYDCTLNLFKHEFFKENEDLVIRVIKGEAHYKNLRYHPPASIPQRNQLEQKQPLIFNTPPYNYLHPYFDVTENVGPKFKHQ